jgi:hypothetical protein
MKMNPSLLILILISAIFLLMSDAFAQGRGAQDNGPNNAQSRSFPGSSRIIRPSIGQRVSVLPSNHQIVRVGVDSYRYANGSFYRPGSQGAYIVVNAPLNARVDRLPLGAVSFYLGSRRYYYANFTYFLWDSDRREYRVVDEPDGAEIEVASASQTTGEIFVYPAEGQSEEQRDRDRYDCYLWASEQTGFDPSMGEQDSSLASNYRRAISACLEGRGYTVK